MAYLLLPNAPEIQGPTTDHQPPSPEPPFHRTDTWKQARASAAFIVEARPQLLRSPEAPSG